MEALQAEALRRAKEMLVLREIMAAQTFPVTPEELEAEAAAIARRQNTTVAELKRFLGEDLAMLQSDLKSAKPPPGPANRWPQRVDDRDTVILPQPNDK